MRPRRRRWVLEWSIHEELTLRAHVSCVGKTWQLSACGAKDSCLHFCHVGRMASHKCPFKRTKGPSRQSSSWIQKDLAWVNLRNMRLLLCFPIAWILWDMVRFRGQVLWSDMWPGFVIRFWRLTCGHVLWSLWTWKWVQRVMFLHPS